MLGEIAMENATGKTQETLHTLHALGFECVEVDTTTKWKSAISLASRLGDPSLVDTLQESQKTFIKWQENLFQEVSRGLHSTDGCDGHEKGGQLEEAKNEGEEDGEGEGGEEGGEEDEEECAVDHESSFDECGAFKGSIPRPFDNEEEEALEEMKVSAEAAEDEEAQRLAADIAAVEAHEKEQERQKAEDRQMCKPAAVTAWDEPFLLGYDQALNAAIEASGAEDEEAQRLAADIAAVEAYKKEQERIAAVEAALNAAIEASGAEDEEAQTLTAEIAAVEAYKNARERIAAVEAYEKEQERQKAENNVDHAEEEFSICEYFFMTSDELACVNAICVDGEKVDGEKVGRYIRQAVHANLKKLTKEERRNVKKIITGCFDDATSAHFGGERQLFEEKKI